MINYIILLLLPMLLVACNSRDFGANAPTSKDRANAALAVQKVNCAFENQKACAHIIENRILLARFFAPETLGGLDGDEKVKGRRVTTRFVVDNVAEIKQCRPVAGESIPLIRDIDINNAKYQVHASKPVTPQSLCFLKPEAS